MRGISLDYAKCFDRFLVHIVLKIAARQGVDAWLITPLQRLYNDLDRRFKFGNSVGEPFKVYQCYCSRMPLLMFFS